MERIRKIKKHLSRIWMNWKGWHWTATNLRSIKLNRQRKWQQLIKEWRAYKRICIGFRETEEYKENDITVKVSIEIESGDPRDISVEQNRFAALDGFASGVWRVGVARVSIWWLMARTWIPIEVNGWHFVEIVLINFKPCVDFIENELNGIESDLWEHEEDENRLYNWSKRAMASQWKHWI